MSFMYAAHTDVHGTLRVCSKGAAEHAPAACCAPPPPPPLPASLSRYQAANFLVASSLLISPSGSRGFYFDKRACRPTLKSTYSCID